jgi:FkbM family methyltransferase
MLTSLLSSIKARLKQGALRAVLERLGLVALGRWIYNCQVLRCGVHEARVLGRSLRFVVSNAGEITRIDSLTREVGFVERLLSVLQRGDVFVDVGANIGVISLIVADETRATDLTIHCFEPEPANVARLRRNVSLNGFQDRVTVHEVALGRRDERARFFVRGQVGAGMHSLLVGPDAEDEAVDVQVVTAGRYMQELQVRCDVVKIDVEGSEMDVLAGMHDLFASGAVRHLLIEVHPRELAAAGSDPDALRRWLEDRDYDLIWSSGRGLQIHQHYVRKQGS